MSEADAVVDPWPVTDIPSSTVGPPQPTRKVGREEERLITFCYATTTVVFNLQDKLHFHTGLILSAIFGNNSLPASLWADFIQFQSAKKCQK